MKPILYASTETAFADLGIGVLADALSCYVEEERNGSYELTAVFPANGQYVDQIQSRSIILAKPNYADQPQPFRVYKIAKSMSGSTVTVNAEHISYDLAGWTASPFVAGDIQAALSGLTSHSITPSCPFTLTSSRATVATFTAGYPASIRSWLGGKEGSLLDVYGGEWHYDRFAATLENNRGTDRGMRILYGKNLLTLEQEEECSNLYSGVYPYFVGEDGTVVTGSIVSVAAVNYTRILSLDMTENYMSDEGVATVPTSADLTADATAYIARNNLATPKVNLKLDFAQIEELPERVDLCDYVTVYFERFGVSAYAECIRTKWDVLRDRYAEIELGDAKESLANTILDTKESISNLETTVSDYTQGLYATVATVNETMSTNLAATNDAITAVASRTTTIEESYIDENGVETLLAQHDYVNSTHLQQTADGITATVTALSSTVDDQGAQLDELTTAVTVDINGVTVGKSNSDIKGVFGNSSLDFVNGNGDKLAWISAEDDGLGAYQLSLGDPSLNTNRWRIFTSSDGSHLRFTRHT